MQRITRLLTGSTPSSRWRLPLGLVLLLGTGALLATQVELSGHSLPNMHFQSSTDGKLGPGDERVITANGLDKQRYYRANVDRAGRLTEVYKENGQLRPIDADTRDWIAEMTRLAVTPPPPPPPVPPMPPVAPPPPPPAPPPPPEVADSLAFQQILGLVAADPGVLARLGSPIAAQKPVSGHVDIDQDTGEARLTFIASGPKGKAQVTANARMDRNAWTLQTVELAGVPR